MAWTITSTQNEEAWFSDYVADVIAYPLPPLPPHDSHVGHVETHWHEVSPGRAYVATNPEHGTPDDRLFAKGLIVAQLVPHGYQQAVYTLSFSKTAGWASQSVMDKAKRLVQTGAVKLDRNSGDVVVGRVMGDGTDNDGEPDEHKVELHKTYPGSDRLTGMFCDCDWGKFLNTPRTRTWKDFQYTPCSHIIATYWASRSVPTDEARAPGDSGGPGQMMLPGMPSGGQPGPSMGVMRGMPMQPGAQPQMAPESGPQGPGAPQGQQMGIPGLGSPGGQAPPPEDVLPQFPMQEMQLPQVNPASTPGGRPGPTPTNPLQYPGGTFSSVRIAVTYQNGEKVRLKKATQGQYVGRPESGKPGMPVDIPAGAVGEVLGSEGSGDYEMTQVLWMGNHFEEFGKLMPFGATFWCFTSELSPVAGPPPGPAIRRLY